MHEAPLGKVGTVSKVAVTTRDHRAPADTPAGGTP